MSLAWALSVEWGDGPMARWRRTGPQTFDLVTDLRESLFADVTAIEQVERPVERLGGETPPTRIVVVPGLFDDLFHALPQLVVELDPPSNRRVHPHAGTLRSHRRTPPTPTTAGGDSLVADHITVNARPINAH
jgi:hypothetical protein